MSNYDNNMSGALFKNVDKDRDQQPDYKGTAEVDGVEYWISAWLKEGQKGKYMRLAFTAKNAPKNPPARLLAKPLAKPTSKAAEELPDDDVPF